MSATKDLATPAELGVDDEERPARTLSGWPERLVALSGFAIAILVLWQVFRPLPQGSQYYLVVFLAVTLPLVFLSYRSGWRYLDGGTGWVDRAHGPAPWDWLLAVLALLVCLYPVLPLTIGSGGGGYDAFLDRQGLLDPVDIAMGALVLLLVAEACRRTTGWVLPLVCALFLAYGYYGGLLPQHWSVAHAGLDFDQIVDALYNSGSGFYGTPLDVAASYIALFTIYGAVLEFSGAARFFVELSVAAFRRSRTAAGRTAVTSGFLLGTVSGSGTATAVTNGAVTWPILRKAGYRPEQAGGMLAAAGVGAILSPPTLGVAAFIVAEYLEVSYLTVLLWATIPTLLYYLGILLAVEIDARRFHRRGSDDGAPTVDTGPSAWKLLARFGYHFLSLLAIVVLMLLGFTATKAVVYATALAFLLAVVDRAVRQWPTAATRRDMLREFAVGCCTALSGGIRAALPVVAVCAAAGIITAMTTKTGLGAQLAGVLVRTAEAISDNATVVLACTVVLAAVALALLGLAIPVTASFVIGWVIIAPALLSLGVSGPATAMFVFYYSVLSEVTPPTALAAVGAAAVTGAKPIPTMWQTLRYALPAFLVPMVFVLTGTGERLLGRGPLLEIAATGLMVALGVAALAMATGGWVLGVGEAGWAARVLAGLAGLILLYPSGITLAIGAALLAAAALLTRVLRRDPPSVNDIPPARVADPTGGTP
ncbi:TRAP transporter fused permease subunit [Nocardia otitidiscaviarum]|uniref:TRAP transporter permease n=1 Tax=Nocardia otitidiscaviarum TaxID=1823 RepID=UPI000693EE60|nr:TRAP transporter fused permease subunit [Nocardia otitidiscaviarum]MBF6134656.1 TRAP transporter fused permease subunit [Nocardia otitidiscaviarum]MBF6485718.1 TRAP transporter fused permease subunit [Nocardia otitidiscaviarum]